MVDGKFGNSTLDDADVSSTGWSMLSCLCLKAPLMPSTGSVSLDLVIPIDLTKDAAFYFTFKFVAILWMALPQTKYVLHPRHSASL